MGGKLFYYRKIGVKVRRGSYCFALYIRMGMVGLTRGFFLLDRKGGGGGGSEVGGMLDGFTLLLSGGGGYGRLK